MSGEYLSDFIADILDFAPKPPPPPRRACHRRPLGGGGGGVTRYTVNSMWKISLRLKRELVGLRQQYCCFWGRPSWTLGGNPQRPAPCLGHSRIPVIVESRSRMPILKLKSGGATVYEVVEYCTEHKPGGYRNEDSGGGNQDQPFDHFGGLEGHGGKYVGAVGVADHGGPALDVKRRQDLFF